MESANYVAVIAILAEMARCLNKNISKVHLTPIDFTAIGDASIDLAKLSDGVTKA
jgi:hypothetical protein